MKKNILLSLLLVFAILCEAQNSCWDGTVADAYDGGDGTPENPYQIATPQQLALLAQQTNNGTGGDACYILTEDICLNENVGPGGFSWTTIGYYKQSSDNIGFSGVFDGNGHTISNLYSDNNENINSIGLFGMTENAVIKNVNITGALLTSQVRVTAGMITAYAYNSDVLNCTASGSIQAIGTMGGIIGQYHNSADTTYIANCVNNTIFDNTNMTGGIVGEVMTTDSPGHISEDCTIVIENCINHSDISSLWSGGITAKLYGIVIVKKCENYGKIQSGQECGGIVGQIGLHSIAYSHSIIEDCINHADADITAYCAGGIAGRSGEAIITRCVNNALITSPINADSLFWALGVAGGISGVGGIVSNCYNRGDVTAVLTDIYDINYYVYLGGIIGADEPRSESHADNVYNTGNIITPDLSALNYNNTIETGYGNIVGDASNIGHFYNCYWLDDDDFPAAGLIENGTNMPGSCAFVQGDTPTSWVLNEPQYDTTDLLEALNEGSLGQCTWLEDVSGINDGYPIIEMSGESDYHLVGNEWYYEITNANGSVTYQHLFHQNDTTIDDKKVQVIVKTNTLYDKNNNNTTREYIYEENNKVYWWNKTTEEFTVLYDFSANKGDEWTITAGDNSILVHVDEVGYYIKDARWFKSLIISDNKDIFNGTILCSVGHLTSFFPEKLMYKNQDFEIEGIRCYWKNDILIYKEDDTDCDAVYNQWHLGVDEAAAAGGYDVYPNPSNGVLHISTYKPLDYQIINIHGDTVLSGTIALENQQVDMSNLTNGVYLIIIDRQTVKIIINK